MFPTPESSADEIVVDAQPSPFTLTVSRTAGGPGGATTTWRT